MSSKDNIKFRYRIIIGKNNNFPYEVQRKGWFFWHSLDKERTLEQAEYTLKNHVQHESMRPGTVIKEYDEKDLVIDKLKGH